MGCPNAVVAGLAVLQGVEDITFDPPSRLFTIEVANDFDTESLDHAIHDIGVDEGRSFRLENLSPA